MPFYADDPSTVVDGEGGVAVQGDICPTGWEQDFDRSQMSTQVLIGRRTLQVPPPLQFSYVAATATPSSGQATLDNTADHHLATSVLVNKTPTGGMYAGWYLRNLNNGSTIRFAIADDTNKYIGFGITGDSVDHGTYFSMPAVWIDGQDAIPAGPILVTMTFAPEPPQLWEDALGKSLYGRELFNRLDLINMTTDTFELLATRLLQIRGVNSVPRLEAVTLDARRGVGLENMAMMSTARPERPSRYKLRLQAEDGRQIFDRMMFVNGIRHFISNNEWTLRVALDTAEWAAQL